MKSCWSPCFWYNNVVEGSVAVAVYTLAMSICVITYTSYVMNGGDATQLWLPFFETNLNTTTQVSISLPTLVVPNRRDLPVTWGQSFKTFHTFGQIYKPVLKHDNML